MYCPRCGQERISDRTIFCSKCGLLLDYIVEVVGNGGEPLTESGVTAGFLARIFCGRNVRIVGLLWFVVITLMLLPMAAILDAPEEVLGILGLLGPVGALLLLVLSLFFPKAPSTRTKNVEQRIRKDQQRTEQRELPPDRTAWASDFVPPSVHSVADSEFAGRRPPSVTEDTTRHLKMNDED